VTSTVLAGIAGKVDMNVHCKVVIHRRMSVVTNAVDAMTQIAINWPCRTWLPMLGISGCKDIRAVPGSGQAHGYSLGGKC
jgi:hypothetical protein